MRRYDINLPVEIFNYSLQIKQEINRIENKRITTVDDLIYIIIQISAYTEQSIKIMRSYIIRQEQLTSTLQYYFKKKNETQPIYPNSDSFMKILSDFGIDDVRIKWSSISEIHGLLFFESGSDFKEFESRVKRLRNQAAHEVAPNLNLTIIDVCRIFDYLTFLLEYHFNQLICLGHISNCSEMRLISSLSSYSECFMSNSIQKEFRKIIYTKKKIEIASEKCKQILFDVRGHLDYREIELIVTQYFNTRVPKKGVIINKKFGSYSFLSKEIKNEIEEHLKNKDISSLSDILHNHQEIVNYPILISKGIVIFGLSEITDFLQIGRDS